MPYLNKIYLMGTLSRAPALEPAATPIAILSLNVRRGFLDKASRTRRQEFTCIDVATFGNNASSCVEHLKEGAAVFIEGYVKVDSWKHRKTGVPRSKLIIIADYVQFLDSPGGERQENSTPAAACERIEGRDASIA